MSCAACERAHSWLCVSLTTAPTLPYLTQRALMLFGACQTGVAGGMGGSRSGQVMASRGQQQQQQPQLGGGVQNISGGLARPQASHGGMVGPAGLNPPPPTASSPPIGSAQLSRQGGASGQSAISLPSTSNSYNPSVDLFTMINRQGTPTTVNAAAQCRALLFHVSVCCRPEASSSLLTAPPLSRAGSGGGIVNGNGFTPQPPIGTMKQMPINLDPKGTPPPPREKRCCCCCCSPSPHGNGAVLPTL